MATILTRINQLLAAHSPDTNWRQRAQQLASATTRRSAFEQHPMLRRLRELDQGWLDKSAGVRLEQIYPNLADVAFCQSMELDLASDESLDQSGPHADFDPLNSVYLANIPYMSVWYSLICLPDEPITRWPVVQCDPSIDDSVMTVAVNIEHFVHQWMCRDGPEFLSPLISAPKEVAHDLIAVMGAVFKINTKEAIAALQHNLDHDDDSDQTPTPRELAPYIDAQTLRQLDRFCIPQSS